MFRRSLPLSLLTLLVVAVGSSWGATGYGHFILAREIIRSGRDSFPPELKTIIADPECQKAFCGGAMAPDIAEDFGHYGNTSDGVQKMLSSARSHLAEAQKRRDPQATRAAQQELAFSYGWLTHCAADLNIHPAVNAFPVCGDAFKYLDKPRQIAHGAIEVQLDAYLAKTYGRAGPEWMEQFKIPWEFLSEQSDEYKVDLKKTAWWTNVQSAAGIAWMQKVDLDLATAQWADIVKVSLQDSLTFIKDPKQFQNWDLCVGRMSTAEFDGLRAYEMSLNGGKLPAGWGKNCLQIHQTRRAEWAKVEEAARRFNHQLPPLPELKFDTLGKQVDDWLAACLQKLEADKAIDPARMANRDMCLAYAKRIQETGNNLYCHNCGKVTAQYWCPGDADLGDHWMCGCSAVTKVSQLIRPDGRSFTDYATSRIAANDAMQAQLRALAARMKTEGRTSPAVRRDITQFIAKANGQVPATPATTTAQATGKPTGTVTGKPPTTTTPRPGATGGQGTSTTGQGDGGQTAGGTSGGAGQASNTAGQSQTALVPAAGGIVRNAQYGFSMQVPSGWKNDPIAAGEGVAQRFRLNGAKATLVEITCVDTGGLTLDKLREIATKITEGNPVLAQKVQEKPLQVPQGVGLDALYTGAQAGNRIMTLVRYISVANRTYVIAGTVPAGATQAECKVVADMVESFRWTTP